MTTATNITHISLHKDYDPVADAFATNFTDGLESGAGLCIYKDGQVVVDLFGGSKDRAGREPWARDTIVPVYSTTKAITALVLALLVERQQLDYQWPLSQVWPELCRNGKDGLNIGQLLSHQSGLSGISEPMQADDWYDWEFIIDRLENQAPIWPPKSSSGYHPQTFGFLAGELAKRTDPQGRSLGTILREDICAPHGIDFMIGTPATEHERCAAIHKPKQLPDFGTLNAATRAAFMQPWSSPKGRPSGDWRAAEFAAANGHGTATALARLMHLALNGAIDDTQYLSAQTLSALGTSQIQGPDLVLPFFLNIGPGLMINNEHQFYGPNQSVETPTLGHSGWGGSCAFADRAHGVTFAYIMNKQSQYLMGDPRTLRIIDALYQVLGV